MNRIVTLRRQDGAVVVTVSLVLLFLLGFTGIALDFGHLFVIKTELQTAMDSCALAAAQELDGQSTALTRATSAGLSAGNRNNVNFQSATWSSQGKISDADITFRNAAYAPTTTPATARYAQCQHTQPNIQMWLLHIMGAFSGADPAYSNTKNVSAFAVATRASAQTTCPVPLALKPKTGGTAPDYGFNIGEWVTLLMAQNAAQGGQIGWANLDGSSSASETEAEMNGFCGTEVGDALGTPGVQASVADAWNARFGIYKNNSGPSVNQPDFTGYAYTSTNWTSGQNAYDDFVAKRSTFASCADTGTSVNTCESITGLSLNSFQNLAAPGNATGGHRDYGANRRLVTVPVINGASQVIDYACMLMLQPLSIPMATSVQLEFRGNAGAADSPCTTIGFAGGVAGPLVPVLVR
jgi:hypothetical protein